MNVVVTGGSGQLGTLVLRRLMHDRKVKRIVSLDRLPPRVASSKVHSVLADVRDPDLARHFEGADALIHLAFAVTTFLPRPEFDAINVGGSKNVFTTAAAAGVTRIVYSSSIAAYGVVPGHPVPIVETTPRVHRPDFAYSATKHEVEAFLDEFEPAHPGIAIARLRPAVLVGAHMEHALGDMLRRGIMVRRAGNGLDVPLPLVWDEDVADAVMLALRAGARGAFNTVAEEPLSSAELARAAGLRLVSIPKSVGTGLARVSSLLGKAGIGRPMDPAWLDGKDAVMIASSAKARAELGWKPRCPTTADVIRRHVAEVPQRPDRRIVLFLRLVDFAGKHTPPPAEARGVAVRMQLELTGPGGGTWGLDIAHGRLAVSRVAPRPPGAVVTLRADTFLDLLAGRGDVTSLQMTGKIRIEGEPAAGMVLGGLISTFRGEVARPRKQLDPRGIAVRALSSWFAKGAPSP